MQLTEHILDNDGECLERRPVAFSVRPRSNCIQHMKVTSFYRWFHQSNCVDNPFFNATICNDIIDALPGCLDAIQYAYEQSTPMNRYAALEECDRVSPWELATRNNYDWREKVCILSQLQFCSNALHSSAPLQDAI